MGVKMTDKNHTISSSDRMKKQAADNFAVASIALEGFVANEKSNELAKKFVDGEITIEQEIMALTAYFANV